jgi:16S rRNA (cytidine1402-2'-O)-methyltransferase
VTDTPPGTLYLVATPIGNLEDITLRALRVLREVDVIACEDTRRTRRLLSHYEIRKPLVSYHEHNERKRAVQLAAKLSDGQTIALVSDAGMPLISDPGYRIVSEAVRRGFAVVPVPGASALIAALAASGLPVHDFFFAGFMPARRKARRNRFTDLSAIRSTLVFYETPHRIVEFMEDAVELLGDRSAVLAREITKLHEEFLRGRLSDLAQLVTDEKRRGEMVVMVAPAEAQAARPTSSVRNRVEALIHTEGLDRKTALKRVARELGITRAQAYSQVLNERDSEENGPDELQDDRVSK